MVLEDVFPVLLVMLVCIPLTIMLVHDILREKEVKVLTQRVEAAEELLGALLGIVDPRQLAEADLPPDIAARGGGNPNV